jgi:CheY-like chemotaxis protein
MTSEKTAKRILIIERDAELARLLETILLESGYDARWMLRSPAVLQQVHEHNPDLLVIHLSEIEKGECQLLDKLRTDPITVRIPVMITTGSDQLAQESLASYNVRSFLTNPFDLDVFLERVGQALDRPPLHASILPKPHTGLVALAERILAERSRDALFRWVQRLRAQAPWRDRTDLKLYEILDSIPVLVEAFDAALHYGSAEEFFRIQSTAVERVREHSRLRREQGFTLMETIHEYALLRSELLRQLWRHLPEQLDREDVLAVTEALNDAVDRVVELTVPAYLGEEWEQLPRDWQDSHRPA